MSAACSDDEDEDGPSDAGVRAEGGVLVVLDGGDELPDPPNGAQACGGGACNYQTQSPCASSQSCSPQLSNGSVVPACQAAGSQPEGASCAAWSDCAAGLFCAEGACRKLCCGGDWSACPSGQSCFRSLFVRDPATDAAVSSAADVCAPVDNCNILDPNACNERPGLACQVIDPLGHVACAREGQHQLGDSCSRDAPCARGLLCRGGECIRLCRAVPGDGAPCTAGREACIHFNRDPAGVGECTPI